jgi:hypothetical protein
VDKENLTQEQIKTKLLLAVDDTQKDRMAVGSRLWQTRRIDENRGLV